MLFEARPRPAEALRRLTRDAARAALSLEMHVHLTSGSAVRFVQPDREGAERLMARIQPQRLFRDPQITLAGGGSLTAFPTAAVEQISLLVDEAPAGWTHPADIEDVLEVPSSDLKAPRGSAAEPLFGEFEMRSGRHVYLRVTPKAPPPDARRTGLDFGLAFAHFFEQAAVFGRRSEGGVFLLNPRNVVRFSTYPSAVTTYGSGALPAGALPAGYFYG